MFLFERIDKYEFIQKRLVDMNVNRKLQCNEYTPKSP